MAGSVTLSGIRAFFRFAFAAVIAVAIATSAAQAQQPPLDPPARIVVIGTGEVGAAPDFGVVSCGVTVKAKTAKEATDANSKAMSAIAAALRDAGVEQKDIQTSRFSLQPVYAPPQPNSEPRLTGFLVSNQFSVTIRNIGQVGDILDRLIAAGATDIGGVQFEHSNPSKLLDQAREAAIADARRKAEIYAQAAGLSLGAVGWITEDSGYTPSMPFGAMRAAPAMAAVPIAPGEDTVRVRITVGFETAH